MKTVDIFRRFVTVLACLSVLKCVGVAGLTDQDGGGGTMRSTVQYTRESLLLLKALRDRSDSVYDLPDEMKRTVLNDECQNSAKKRKRGKRGGVMRRLRRNKNCPPLPSMIMANVRSIRPKSDNMNFEELIANVRLTSEYKNTCLMCFSETWWNEDVSDDSVAIEGFGTPFRTDRDSKISGKRWGGGVGLYVNERWCSKSSVTVRKQLNTRDLDLLYVSFRPRYLPREFGQIFVTVIYTPPHSNPSHASAQIADVIRELQLISPDAPNFIAGDFNDCDLRTNLPTFHQYVTVPTCKNKTIDLVYGNVPKAYRSFVLPPVGNSDHNSVFLVPAYKPKIQTEPVVKKSVKVWSQDSVEQLQGCFECTDWDMFLDSSVSVDEATEVISDYVNFCEDMIVPSKTVKLYPNNKPWISKSLKATLNEKKVAFQTGDRVERKVVQNKLRKEILEAKRQYKEKVESQFESGSLADAWKGLKTLSGQAKSKSSSDGMPMKEQVEFSEKLNEFYCRFEKDDLKDDLDSVTSQLKVDMAGDEEDFEIQGKTVEKVFSKLNVKKAVGPDNIGGRVLRSCACQLSVVFSRLFSWSLKDCTVPRLWKNSTICPVPKNNKPKTLNDYRPVALTSIVMKCFERIVLFRLLHQVKPHQDPFQFAYKQNRCTDDATLTLLHNAYTHLEKPGSFVRILFIDFSSAFNTIQPCLMARKLLLYSVTPRLILWIINFLVNRTQSVRFQTALSSLRSTSIGSPQGTVISPVLFTLYTNDCSGTDSTLLIKYSDDTALEDLSNSDATYFAEVERFNAWCKDNFLDLNVTKTKELLIDFRRNPAPVPDLMIDGVTVERVTEYKYLGTVIDDKLSFNANTTLIHKKCQSRIYCLQKLRKLNVNSSILQTFYRSFIESVITFGFVSWYGGLSVKNRNVLVRMVNVSSKVIGRQQASVESLYEKRVVRKSRRIASDRSHVLAHLYELLPSGRRLRTHKARTLRLQNSFIPKSITLSNM